MQHYLKGNATCRIPSTHAVFDCETYRDETTLSDSCEFQRLRLGHCIHWRFEGAKQTRRRVLNFFDADHFWSSLCAGLDPGRPLWLWSHNLGFDFTVSEGWDRLTSYGYRLRNPVIDDPPTILHWHLGKKHLVCLDSLNWLRVSLETVGQSVGLQKLPFPGFECDNDELMIYCIRDTEILEQAVLSLCRFCREHDLGVLQKTAPAQAMQAYRHRFAPRLATVENVPATAGTRNTRTGSVCPPCLHGQSKVLTLERSSYYGGEAQSYYIGRVLTLAESMSESTGRDGNGRSRGVYGPVYHLDHSGFYPSVMRGNLYPCKLRSVLEGPTVADLARLAGRYGLVASVLLNSESRPYPIRLDGATVYAVGQFWTVLAGPELQEALRADCVGAVGTAATYDLADLFTGYVDYFWQQRVRYTHQGLTLWSDLCKLLLNSLYGKFGQKHIRWKDAPRLAAEKDWGEWSMTTPDSDELTHCRALAGCVQVLQQSKGQAVSFPAIASYVTSYGRCKMTALRQLAGPGNVYYQGDDSIHVSQAGFDRLYAAGHIEPGTLGKLRVVQKVDSAEYRGVRDYTLAGTDTIAGVKDPKANAVAGGHKVTEFERLQSVCSEKPRPGITVRHLVRCHPPLQPSGVLGDDGWIRPRRLSASGTD